MEKDFNTGLRRSIESDRVRLTRRRKQLLREMGYSEDLESTEIAEKLHEQTLANDALNRSIVHYEAEIAKLKSRIAELETGKKPIVKTSANSSVPPSKNPIGVPHTQSLRKPSGNKTGGQKGHQGNTRLQSENVGPNITALVSYLSTYQNVPFKRLTHLLETIFGLHVSEGSVSNMLNSMRKLSKTPYEMIRRKVADGKVAGADETGVNINGKNSWLWAFQNAVATYLAFDKSRGHDVINDNVTPEELGGKAWVTDRWPAYFIADVGMESHQICIAHLLRNLTYTMQAFPDDAWSLDMMDLLRDSVHSRNRRNIGQDVRAKMEKRLDELLSRPPVYTKDDGKDTELDRLKKSIAKHRDHVFTFLTDPAVPPTNNDREKALRPAKTKLKVSGCFRTENGVENYATVASVIQTAVKNGQNPFEVLRVIATLAGE